AAQNSVDLSLKSASHVSGFGSQSSQRLTAWAHSSPQPFSTHTATTTGHHRRTFTTPRIVANGDRKDTSPIGRPRLLARAFSHRLSAEPTSGATRGPGHKAGCPIYAAARVS